MPLVRRELRACPLCLLTLALVSDDRGLTCEYDVTEWARVCRHPDTGSPVACPATRSIREEILKSSTPPD
jgi:hypothetical protein